MTDDVVAVHEHVLALLAAGQADAILDVGCGEGEHLRMLAARVPANVRLVGVDVSEESIRAARVATQADPRYSFLVHDVTTGLPFRDGSFDRVLSVNVLEAIPDRTALLKELHRVLRRDGRLILSHFDWDSQLFDGSDKAAVRQVVHAYADWRQNWMAAADGWMGRRLWRTVQETGLFSGRTDAFVHTSNEFAAGHYGWERAEDFRSMVKHGVITPGEYDEFRAGLENLAAEGRYFYAITMFSYVGIPSEKQPDCSRVEIDRSSATNA